MKTPPENITLAEAARTIPVSINTLYKLIDKGHIRTVRIFKRRLVKRADVIRVRDHGTEARDAAE